MITRLAAAAVGLAVLLPAVIFGGEAAVEIVVPLAALVCLAEYAAMAFPDDRHVSGGFLVAAWLGVYLPPLYLPALAPVAALLVALVTLVFVTFRPGETLERSADKAARLVLGAVWIGLLAFLPLLRRADDGLALCFLVLAASWLGDTGGYFAGKYLGRHAMYPKVSPKKTWEGAVGGIALATLGVVVVRAVGLPHFPIALALVLGPVLCVAGIVGDLSESMLKRSFDVKDAGWILPGHGGLLDRIDSVMFVAPVLWVALLVGGRV